MTTQGQGTGVGRAEAQLGLTPRSTHTSDPFLRDFLDPAFDPATYLNAVLPPLASGPISSSASSSSSLSAPASSSTSVGAGAGAGEGAGVPLAEVSSRAQALLLQLNTQTTRLSGVLTQLVDEILRSGSRLAYEVELLRGEALGLEETMTERLRGEMEMFVPGGIMKQEHQEQEKHSRRQSERGQESAQHEKHDQSERHQQQQRQQQEEEEEEGRGVESTAAGEDPVFIKQLQTLTLVRARLDSVIKTFGDAMEFVFPPSEISLSSGFLSVSAPEPGSERQSSEEKGHEVLRSLREEISGLLSTKSEDPVRGIEEAAERVAGLKELATVWRGTAEEKGRARFVEGLAKMVEDRHRDLLREAELARREGARQGGRSSGEGKAGGAQTGAGGPGGPGGYAAATGATGATAEDGRLLPGGFGLMSQLQKLRSGL